MEFDKSKVYTALNADEVKVGSVIVGADTMLDLKEKVTNNDRSGYGIIREIKDELYQYRFITSLGYYSLAYLIEEPKKQEVPQEKKLKWTDLKVGDIISKENVDYMVITIDRSKDVNCHICLGSYGWITDERLEEYELKPLFVYNINPNQQQYHLV